jgi:threonine aldolase
MDNTILHFESDYLEGGHPLILQRLMETNLEKTTGYGEDTYCENARTKIRTACGCPGAEVRFLTGGTQTNAVVIAALLRSWQGVISAQTGHINVHEAGAIEATGHKVITLPQKDGKLDSALLSDYCTTFFGDANREHMVEPGLVYISHPTEYGTLYTKRELEALHDVCTQYHIPLFLDGARLGYGLAAENTDVTLKTITQNCNIFYIGGTKVGALFGEAVVVPDKQSAPHFFTVIKQHGALLAKGRILGIQFDTLFTNDLYYKISRNAIDNAMLLKHALKEKNVHFYNDSPTNQQFLILENNEINRLSEHIGFGFWEKYDETHTIMRLATSWATKREDIEKVISYF